METILAHFGYPAVFVGTFLEGETFILLGGFLAQRGYLNLSAVVVVAALGAFAGDLFYFALGRIYGRRLIVRSRRARRLLPWLERFVARHHALWIFGVRYFYGMRWLAAVMAGSSKLKVARFTAMALPACLVWAVLVGALGCVFGLTMERVLGDLRHYEGYLLVTVVFLGVIYGVAVRLKERRIEMPMD